MRSRSARAAGAAVGQDRRGHRNQDAWARSHDTWVVRETLYGRWTTLPRRRKAGVAVGAVLALSGLIGLGMLVASSSLFSGFSGSDTRTQQAAEPDVRKPPKPSLILPTVDPAGPDLPEDGESSGSPGGAAEPPHATVTVRPDSIPAEHGEVTYDAWAGHGCVAPKGGGYYAYGTYSDGIEGWYSVGSGGHDGDGCDGSFSAVPMSGRATEDEGGRVVWWWSVGRDSDECALGVWVPTSDNGRDVAGDPTMYQVLSDPNERDSVYDAFLIDQAANRGRLVEAGTYPVEDGRIAVEMLDRGRDWNHYGPTYAHHAAAQMKVVCQKS
ncbi:adhesin [Streptomyces sp. 8N706]|uniref:adhesin n=1 Tax=Streptomyces sp. 8N706 TaxID=3457416 RepID=UPI003FD34573